MLPTKFQVYWPLGSGEEAKNRFSRWQPGQLSWISDQNDFSYFWSTSHLDASYQVSSQLAFLIQETKLKTDFQDGGHNGHLGFQIGKILANFYLQVTPMLPTKFPVNWPIGSGGETKNRFSRWRPYWISDLGDFSYFWSTSHFNDSYQVSSQLAPGCRRSKLLKQTVDAVPHMPLDGRWTLTEW